MSQGIKDYKKFRGQLGNCLIGSFNEFSRETDL